MKEVDEGKALDLYGCINVGRMQEAQARLSANPELIEGFYGYKKQPMMVDAAESGHLNVMMWLRAHKVSLEQVDAVGFTPLHAAVYGYQPLVVAYLIENHVNLERVCEGGETALLTAGRMGYLDLFDVLVAGGANPLANTGPDEGGKDAVTLFLGNVQERVLADWPARLSQETLWGLCDRLSVSKEALLQRIATEPKLGKNLAKAGWGGVLADLKSTHLDQQWQPAPVQAPRVRM